MLRAEAVTLEDFVAAVTAAVEVPTDLASEHLDGVPVYDGALVADRSDVETEPGRQLLLEWARVLLEGTGVFVVRRAVAADIIDEATEVFAAIVAEETADGGPAGDHFAAAGANQRIWNVLEKHCLRAPESFARYYSTPAVAMASLAWLGPGYQVSAQVNMVNPGAPAQEPHRDYHLGFMSDQQAEHYLSHVHRLSPALTLQAAFAHTDMPVETGPTFFLPGSQRYEAGYVAWRNDEVRAYVAEHQQQVALAKGDMLFFNPAVLHGAGANHTDDVQRIANLLQISSPFGRAMEDIDRRAMVAALYPALRRRWDAGDDRAALRRALAACAEGYAFPGDLDRDQPVDGLAPPSDAAIVEQALAEGWSAAQLAQALPRRT
ncbi:MAG: phytanoyl-CoA dioxygenase family protein [Actinomycetota bacterium]